LQQLVTGAVYVAERQVEYWTSRAIEDYFLNAGYDCVAYPLTPHAEHYIPADFIFEAGQHLKIFGLQYKPLHGPTDHWHLTQPQHQTVQSFPWINYGLSELRATRDVRNSLHALRLKSCAFPYVAELTLAASFPYKRWGAFSRGLEDCSEGRIVRCVSEFTDLFATALGVLPAVAEVERMLDVFLLNLDGRRALRFSTEIRGGGELA